ncbi:MAG: ABC-2 type transport system ATP-binding protein [Planctomycetota bacterium]|jgi:ABC-2 type transport system ATP-binding protein
MEPEALGFLLLAQTCGLGTVPTVERPRQGATLALPRLLQSCPVAAPMIVVSNLTRRFAAFTAVDDISFQLAKGEVVGFLGVNGAGKSTTMRMLTGFLPATRGSIAIAGHDVLKDSMKVRASIGYLPEGVPLYREHRVQEMLCFQGSLHGLSRSESKKRAAVVLDRVGLLDRSRSIIGRLSKGQRQRVGLAVALLPDPPVLILDEPTSGLDPLQRREVRQLIGDLAKDRTVLLSSHILPEIESLCPRVIVLHRGRVVADGKHAQLARSMGDGAHVRLEARVANPRAAAESLAQIEGVISVDVEAPASDASAATAAGFSLWCEEDLRAAVGEFALARGWAIQELSFRAPTLEGLFARLAVGEEPGAVIRANNGANTGAETEARAEAGAVSQ